MGPNPQCAQEAVPEPKVILESRFSVACPVWFWTDLGSLAPLPFGMERSVVHLSHHFALEAHNLLLHQRPTAGGEYASRLIRPRVSSISNLDETLDLGLLS